MVAEATESGDSDPDVLFSGKYPPETVVVEQQVLRDGRLVVVVRRKKTSTRSSGTDTGESR
jgi:hypothetical protein